jgi:threonine aldolase
MQQKATIECKNLLGNTLTRHARSEIEMKLLYAIRGANREGICLADSEAQGSAVRQSLVLIVRRQNSRNRGPMRADTIRHQFASDNTAAICPEAWTALEQANARYAPSYGEDEWTAAVCERIRQIFEVDCDVYFVFTGTGANALGLAQLCQPFHGVICHERAHIQTDEGGATEFYTRGAKLFLTKTNDGKIDLGETEKLIAQQVELHGHMMHAISIAQATELGTVYTPGEVEAIGAFARSHRMLLHMDGARFANAVASLGCAPKTITWKAGVDVLSFGGTKNGVAAGELVIFFDKTASRDFQYRVKQAGHLGSKMRFLAAPWLGLLNGDVWLRNAWHANEAARKLAQRLRNEAGMESVFRVESNGVFVQLDDRVVQGLHARDWRFYKFVEPNIYRLMCSWSTTDEEISMLVGDFVAIK